MLRNRRNCDSISAELAFFLVANDVRFSHFHCLLAELLQSQHLLVVQLSAERLHLLIVQLIIGQIQIRTLLRHMRTWMDSILEAIYQIGTLVAQIVTSVNRSGTLPHQIITRVARIGM